MRADKLDTIWELAPHTRAKHELLRNYLGAWFPMLSRYRGRVIVLDAFAGPGVYDRGEPGSPRIVLETLLGHNFRDRMGDCEFLLLFNEQDRERYGSLISVLDAVKDEHGSVPKNIRIHALNDNFPDLAHNILEGLEGADLAPTFAFIDPFGYRDVPIELIARLLAFRRCELFIYFDFNSVSRFATAGNVDQHFEALFGTDEFTQAPPAGDPARGPFLHDLYHRQLRDRAGFDYVQSFEMVNAKGRTGNYLFFCTRSVEGLDKMKVAMWKVAPIGNFRFDDRLVGQPGLFEDSIDTAPLRDAMRDRYRGGTVPIEDVTTFTIVETAFTSSHLKRRTLAPMQRDGLIESPNQKRAGQFPAGTLLRFL